MKFLASLSLALVALTPATHAFPAGAGVQPRAPPASSGLDAHTLAATIKEFDPRVKENRAYYAVDPSATHLSDAEVWEYAEAYYHGVSVRKDVSQDFLVSMIYAPGHGVFMGVKPKTTDIHNDEFAEFLTSVAKVDAPEVYDILQEREVNFEEWQKKNPTSTRMTAKPLGRIHAEDFTYVIAKRAMGGAKSQFPPGTKGAVWGRTHWSESEPGPQDNCGEVGGQAKVAPSCAEAQTRLGIDYLTKATYGSAMAQEKGSGAGEHTSERHQPKAKGEQPEILSPAKAAKDRHASKGSRA